MATRAPDTSTKLEALAPGHYAFCSLQNVSINTWAAPADGPAVAKLAKITETLASRYPRGVSAIHLLGAETPLPTADGRRGLIGIMKSERSALACIGVHLPGAGIATSLMRAFINAARTVAPRSFELRIVATREELVTWIVEAHASRTRVRLASSVLLEAMIETAAHLEGTTRTAGPFG